MWPFKRIKKWFQKTIHNWKVSKVNASLNTLRDIIEKGGSTNGKEQQIESAMSTLKQYPNILKEKNMDYLISFVEKPPKEAFITSINTDEGPVEITQKSLPKAIAQAITQDNAEQLIIGKSFTPLAKGKILTPSSMGTAINYMCTTDSNEEKRSINGTKDFFKKTENNPEKYDKYTSYLQSNYPLLVAVCSTKHNVESISSIVAPAEGFNLTNYKEEVQLTIDTKKLH